ncbi:MAG: hypothetical protein A3G76_07450 [Acidobacteria bacterium RIFCSPLOWO2_12_FULL_65_11]|nr:MAG: hypothetical protein A3H95_13645 [Acidobacteria bacterium RIFCSPLOWO2_02_FULL_64_15]OFW29468.1 MAG: hypothetical protein A3G76_07450 [Acidobacteria bacterium RIFCSPLOWO2_12_FULL_65_11]
MKSESTAFIGRALVSFFIALLGATALECVIRLSSRGAVPITAAMIEWAVSRGVIFGVPLAMLPALWYARTGARQPLARHGVQAALLGVLLTIAVVGWVAPVGMRAYNLERIQRIRRTLEENTRARRSAEVAIPRPPARRAGAPPALRPMTPEEAVAVDATTKTWPDLILSARVDADRARLYRLESRRRAELAALAGVLAFLGWTLSSLGRHALHPVMWWAATWLLTVRTPGVTAGTSLVMFGVAAVTLAMMSRAADGSNTAQPVPHEP